MYFTLIDYLPILTLSLSLSVTHMRCNDDLIKYHKSNVYVCIRMWAYNRLLAVIKEYSALATEHDEKGD